MGMPIIKKGRKQYVCLPFNNTFCLLIASPPNSLSVKLVHETWSYSIVRLLCIIKCALKNPLPSLPVHCILSPFLIGEHLFANLVGSIRRK